MRRRNKRVTIFAVAIALSLTALWLSLTIFESDQPSKSNNLGIADSETNRGIPDIPKAKDPRLDSNPNRPALEPEVLAAFVESSPSGEANALALLLSFDLKYLQRLKSFPESETALQILAMYDTAPDARGFWAEELIAAQPRNGLGKTLMARSYSEQGNPIAAAKSIEEALNSPALVGPGQPLQGALAELLEKMPPQKATDVTLREINLAQISLGSSVFPSDFTGFFVDQPENTGKEIAANIRKLQDRLAESGTTNILNIEGVSDPENTSIGWRLNLLIDYEATYGEGSSGEIDSVGLEDYISWSSERAKTHNLRKGQLSADEVDKRVRTAILNL